MTSETVPSTTRPDSPLLVTARELITRVETQVLRARLRAAEEANARKISNLRDQPRVMLAIGVPGPEFDVELIEATAELPDQAASDVMPEGFGAKYRELLRRAGLTVQRFAEVYSQPIVIRPTRFIGYGGRGWQGSGSFAT